MKKSRVAWVDIAKGICILAVVMMYAVERVDRLPGPGGDWLGLWVAFARPFRMPDFFLISGLFLSRVIDRPWRGYLDKKALHYLYFFSVWSLIYFPFLECLKERPASAAAALLDLARMVYDPYAMLWFIQMLSIYFVAVKLLRRVPAWVILPLALLWQAHPTHMGWPQLDRIGERFIYFYAGFAFAPRFFRLAELAQERPWTALFGLLSWAGVNGALVGHGVADMPGLGAALGLLGAAAVITVSSLLSGSRPGVWLSALGERSIVIYLSFLLPLNAFILILTRRGWTGDRGWAALGLSAASVALALLASRLTRGTPLRFLFERPAWATLEERPAGPAGAGAFSAAPAS